MRKSSFGPYDDLMKEINRYDDEFEEVIDDKDEGVIEEYKDEEQ